VSKSWVLDSVYGFVFRFVKHVLRSRVMPNASKFPHFEAPHDTKHTTKVPPTMCPKHRFSMLFRVLEFRFGHACLTLNLCHTPIVSCVTTLLSRTSQHHHGAARKQDCRGKRRCRRKNQCTRYKKDKRKSIVCCVPQLATSPNDEFGQGLTMLTEIVNTCLLSTISIQKHEKGRRSPEGIQFI
jgi:hypothetical protein